MTRLSTVIATATATAANLASAHSAALPHVHPHGDSVGVDTLVGIGLTAIVVACVVLLWFECRRSDNRDEL